MGAFETLLAALGLNKASFIAGGIGAALAAMKAEGTPISRVVNFTAGFFFAAWGTGFAVNIFKFGDSPTFYGAIGFFLGYLGMAIMDAATIAVASLKQIEWKLVIEKAMAKVGL